MSKRYQELFEPTTLAPEAVLYRKERKKYFGKIILTETAAKNGVYYSVALTEDLFSDERLKSRLGRELREVLETFFNKYGVAKGDKVLVAGLGNEKVTPDRLGCAVCDRLLVTAHLYDTPTISARYGNLAAVKCGVSGTTGIESNAVLRSIVTSEKPKIVLLVDALACNRTERLAKVVQLSDAGMEPGGGVDNAKPILNESSLGVPVVAIGVPTVMYARKILAEFCHGDFSESDLLKTLTVAAKEIDYQIKDFADVIADAINDAVHNAVD